MSMQPNGAFPVTEGRSSLLAPRRLRRAAARCADSRLARWTTHRLFGRDSVVALAYHRIGCAESSPFDRGLFSATAEEFEAQVAFLTRECDVIGPEDLEYARVTRGRWALITFDDGYRDNFDVAFPILQRYRVPATFFVTTSFIDRRCVAWWDAIALMVRRSPSSHVSLPPWLPHLPFDEPGRDRAVAEVLLAYKRLGPPETEAFVAALSDATSGGGRSEPNDDPWMTWAMIRQMARAGMTIGGHTVNHPILTRLTTDQQAVEIRDSLQRVRTETGQRGDVFSYPVGGSTSFDAATVRCLAESGVLHAFSYYGGVTDRSRWRWYDVPRIPVEQELSGSLFRSVVRMPGLFALTQHGAT